MTTLTLIIFYNFLLFITIIINIQVTLFLSVIDILNHLSYLLHFSIYNFSDYVFANITVYEIITN